jgi:hypothetical protein
VGPCVIQQPRQGFRTNRVRRDPLGGRGSNAPIEALLADQMRIPGTARGSTLAARMAWRFGATRPWRGASAIHVPLWIDVVFLRDSALLSRVGG